MLVAVISVDDRPRLWALNILINLSAATENQVQLVSAELGLLGLLRQIASISDHSKNQIKALMVLSNLASHPANMQTIAQDSELLNVVKHVVAEDVGEARLHALCVLVGISTSAESLGMIASTVQGLLAWLRKAVVGDSGKVRLKALQMCYNLSLSTTLKLPIAADELGMLPLLTGLVVQGPPDCKAQALGILSNLSGAVENRVAMLSADLGLVSVLTDTLASTDDSANQVHILITLVNIDDVNNSPLRNGTVGVHLMTVLRRLAYADPDAAYNVKNKAVNLLLRIREPIMRDKILAEHGVTLPLFVSVLRYRLNTLNV